MKSLNALKRGAAGALVLLATQSLTDAANSGILDVIVECTATKIFLPNVFARDEALQVGGAQGLGRLAHALGLRVVAELDGKVVGSNFLAEGGAIAGVGPISVDPKVQNRGVGARLMEDVLKRAAQGYDHEYYRTAPDKNPTGPAKGSHKVLRGVLAETALATGLQPLTFEPGTQWSYSNTGYLILGVLTSRLAGKHWSEFQSERLFKPLGMTTANDWTKEMSTKGFPELQKLYRLLGTPDNVMLKRGEHFPHNYNAVSRSAFYTWLNQHFKLGFPEPVIERDTEYWLWKVTSYGARKIAIYAWYPMSSGYESGGYGLIELDGTITDRATRLDWSKDDSGQGLNWQEALAWAQGHAAAFREARGRAEQRGAEVRRPRRDVDHDGEGERRTRARRDRGHADAHVRRGRGPSSDGSRVRRPARPR